MDARLCGRRFRKLEGAVTDVITSPPYLDTTNYIEDQWLRLWFLGEPAVCVRRRGDHRHTSEENYWNFLEEVWRSLSPMLAPASRFVVRIGGRRIERDATKELLKESIARGTNRHVRLLDKGVTTEIRKTQANVFRGKSLPPAVEHDFSMELVA